VVVVVVVISGIVNSSRSYKEAMQTAYDHKLNPNEAGFSL